jgi:multidrug efflux pump subunit AcrB
MILVFVVLSIIGVGMIPLLNLRYTPSEKGSSLTVNYSWKGASAKLVEMDVTSVIEGLASSMSGVEKIRSVSKKDGGYVTVDVKDKDRMELVRFELGSLIRQTYDRLPKGVTYPVISLSTEGEELSPILVYTIYADMPTWQIEHYAQTHIMDELTLIDGVGSVELSGATPFRCEIAFDSECLNAFGVTLSELRNAIFNIFSEYDAVGSVNNVGVMLKYDFSDANIDDIPIKNVNGHIIRLSDVARIEYKERVPSFYYRVNGLNTINITIYPEKSINVIKISEAVKEKMFRLEEDFSDIFSAIVSYDSSTYLKDEINKIVRRTILSMLILLLFVFIISFNLRYVAVIFVSIFSNILIAFVFYVLFDIELHIYSLTGFSVSLGLIIDASIVMISHYLYYKNSKVFMALFTAQATSIGALSVIFLLSEEQRSFFTDFSAVIIINLAISLLVSLFFIPALVDAFKMFEYAKTTKVRKYRRIARFNNFYAKYITYGKRHRWVAVILVVLSFGLPINMLPDKLGKESENNIQLYDNDVNIKDCVWIRAYNKTLGSTFFIEKLKRPLSKILGGSVGLFLKKSSSNQYRELERPSLNIRASLPDGCTVVQLNELVLIMENYLSQFEEIENFFTYIYNHSNASIVVNFKNNVEKTFFPVKLKNQVIAKASDFGGANWSIYGVNDQSFDNHVVTAYKGERIEFTGYNYDNLYRYCRNCVDELSKNPKVVDPQIYGEVRWGNAISRDEYYLNYDPYSLSVNDLTTRDAYDALSEQMFNATIASYLNEGVHTDIDLLSKNSVSFDVWNHKNEYISVKNRSIRFSEIGEIEKRHSGNDIYKMDQQYSLIVAYEFNGSNWLAEKVRKNEIERLNDIILPIGYNANSPKYFMNIFDRSNLWLLLLVLLIIYFICAICFESLTYPLIILGLIPISFIGLFLTFALIDTSFDQGGFAAFIMLSGLVVNGGIYIIQEYKEQISRGGSYIRAFSYKIVPTLLTVVSTALGLIPFLIDGPNEVFWYDFALGTIGGILFSLIALVLFLPLWMPKKIASDGLKKKKVFSQNRLELL